MKKFSLLTAGALTLVPFVASAQSTIDTTGTGGFLESISEVIGQIMPVVISLAVLFFLFGLVKYVLNQDDADARAGARSIMIWGIVIIFVMVSVWGLVNFLGGFVNLDSTVGSAPEVVPAP